MFSKHLFKVIAGFCGVILVGLISLVIVNSFKDKGKEPIKQALTYNQTEDISIGSVDALETNGSIAPPEVKLLSYQEALGLYVGKIIGINNECQANPNTLSFKNNTNIMIDNYSDTTKTLKIGKIVTVKANGFKIVNLSSTKLPVKLILECDGIKGIANITIYK